MCNRNSVACATYLFSRLALALCFSHDWLLLHLPALALACFCSCLLAHSAHLLKSSLMLDLYSPDTYIPAPPHEAFAELRRSSPVSWQDIPNDEGYWMILRHADVVHVAKEPNLFSAETGGVVVETLPEDQLANMRNMLLAMDPPRHTAWRRNIAPHFKARVIGELEGQIRDITQGIMADAKEMGDVDFVHDVCAHLPSNVMGQIMGIPEEDRPQIHQWAEQQTSGSDPDINPDTYMEPPSANSSMQMAMYAMEHAAKRGEARANGADFDPRPHRLGAGRRSRRPHHDRHRLRQLLRAARDCRQRHDPHHAGGRHLALLQHPETLEEVRADHSLIPGAVEEILRWANPLHYFRRTATADAEISGQKIAKGEKVAMIYTSANRDEEVFDDPNGFNIHRSPNPHLSFGIAQHFCLGVHLARLEGRVFFEELLATFPVIEQTGEARRTRSNLNNLKELPLRRCGLTPLAT